MDPHLVLRSVTFVLTRVARGPPNPESLLVTSDINADGAAAKVVKCV